MQLFIILATIRRVGDERVVITVDGLAGSGKTTLARQLSERLGFIHFSSGLFYRSLGYLALAGGHDPADSDQALRLLERHTIELRAGGDVLIDGTPFAEQLYQPRVSEATSIVASLPELRAALVEKQRMVFPGRALVAEGRDMGTVIFPAADLKFFIHADREVRVKRRLAQLGYEQTRDPFKLNSLKKDIEIEILERDERDSSRAAAPTVAAVDAIIVDNSSQTLTEVVQSMYDAVANRGLLARDPR